MRGFLLGATMWVKFQPSKVYIVKSSCDEAMVNTRNLSLKGTLFLQQKAGDSSEISTAELLNLNLLTSVPQCSGGPWVKPWASQILWLVTANAVVFSHCFCRISPKFTLQVVWNCNSRTLSFLSF